MYVYDEYDQKIVDERVVQYRDQTDRFLAGKLTEAEFLPLRLQNGLYVQRLAPMLRIAVPYGLMSSKQLRKVAQITRDYDKGYAHFSTRQNIQLNWPRLAEVPDLLAELATVQMHAIQTSGNCIRNTTTDQFAGVAPDELEDPGAKSFASGPPYTRSSPSCRANSRSPSVAAARTGRPFTPTISGWNWSPTIGGLGRTPVIGSEVCPWLEKKHLLSYLEAILRVYNQNGRRDNKYKARIKILVKAMGVDAFREAVEQEWELLEPGVRFLHRPRLPRTGRRGLRDIPGSCR
jgi:sulfite reductase (NADPH) hemoprotein beta-component